MNMLCKLDFWDNKASTGIADLLKASAGGLEEEEGQDLARHHGILFLISEMIVVARIMHINLD